MYVPPSYRVQDRASILAFMEAYSFATLFSGTLPEPAISHLPLLLDRRSAGGERLLGHVARANPHRLLLENGDPVQAVFHGPHAYISPSWYRAGPWIPTWNYAVVHAAGRARSLSSPETMELLRRLVEKHEAPRAERWAGDLSEAFLEEELPFIAGFAITIDQLEAKFKLGQNRDAGDRARTIAGLEREPDMASRALADFARRQGVLEP